MIRMSIRTEAFSRRYKEGLGEGLRVVNARQYYKNGDGTQPRLEQVMATPWTFRGKEVIGFADTDLRDANVGTDGLRLTDVSSFYVMGANGRYVDIDKMRTAGDVFSDQKSGRPVNISDAAFDMEKFASAASEYPHVFMHDEYIESRSYINGRFGLNPPTTADYERYLGSMEDQLKDRSFVITGQITKVSQMSKAYDSIPAGDDRIGPREPAMSAGAEFGG